MFPKIIKSMKLYLKKYKILRMSSSKTNLKTLIFHKTNKVKMTPMILWKVSTKMIVNTQILKKAVPSKGVNSTIIIIIINNIFIIK